MKCSKSTATEGALLLFVGVILGVLLAFFVHAYGTREARKAANNVQPPDPNKPKVVFNGQGFVVEKKAT